MGFVVGVEGRGELNVYRNRHLLIPFDRIRKCEACLKASQTLSKAVSGSCEGRNAAEQFVNSRVDNYAAVGVGSCKRELPLDPLRRRKGDKQQM